MKPFQFVYSIQFGVFGVVNNFKQKFAYRKICIIIFKKKFNCKKYYN